MRAAALNVVRKLQRSSDLFARRDNQFIAKLFKDFRGRLGFLRLRDLFSV